MEPVGIWAQEPREMMPGYRGRLVHTQNTSHVYWEVEADSAVPEHEHPHEQIVNTLEGTFELFVGGASHVLNPGDVLVIPGGVPHAGRSHTRCRILDVFSPVREDLR